VITLTQTQALTGSFNYEAGDIKGLAKLVDGQPINQGDQPSFVRKTYSIKFYAKLIPTSNLLLGAEKASLMSYLDRWFVKNAIFTENQAIFDALRTGKTVKAVTGWEALKSSINVDIDPANLIDGAIVTNQTGFAALDAEKDANGRGILTPNPTQPTEKQFQGLPIRIFSDAQLPIVNGKAPMFYGSMKAGVQFIEYMKLEFATSEDFLFNLNQTAIRVIEGFDVIQTDADAYIYATFAPSAAPKA
jgi:HK97 family phage major capsid protein